MKLELDRDAGAAARRTVDRQRTVELADALADALEPEMPLGCAGCPFGIESATVVGNGQRSCVCVWENAPTKRTNAATIS